MLCLVTVKHCMTSVHDKVLYNYICKCALPYLSQTDRCGSHTTLLTYTLVDLASVVLMQFHVHALHVPYGGLLDRSTLNMLHSTADPVYCMDFLDPY